MNICQRRVQSENSFLFFDMEGEDNHINNHNYLLETYMDMEKIMFCENKGDDQIDHCVNYVDFLDNNRNNNKKLRHSFSVDGFSGFSSSNDNNNNANNDNNGNGNGNARNSHGGRKSRDGEAKKAMSPDKLAELWIADPKRAKRILANRQSAARSKERKARYMVELEKKVQSLQREATALSAQLSLFERDTSGLNSENTDLRRQLESMEQQAQLRDALNDALQQELDRLKVATGETATTSDTFIIPSLQNITHTNSQQSTQLATTPDTTNSKLLPLYPFEPTILHSHNIDSHKPNIQPFHSFDFIDISYTPPPPNSYQPIEQNMLNLPHRPDTNVYVETYKQTMPQFYPSQNNGSPLGHLPQFPLESNSETSQDHLSRFQGLDLGGRSTHLIASENMGF